jgi:4a-hydroxytetrahydrobiopterin dehydratase
MPALTSEQVCLKLKAIPEWSVKAQSLCRTFTFEGFLTSIAFVRRVAKRAEKNQHHPDIDIRYDQVTLTLTTHEESGLTEKDFTLAEHCDEIFAKFLNRE